MKVSVNSRVRYKKDKRSLPKRTFVLYCQFVVVYAYFHAHVHLQFKL